MPQTGRAIPGKICNNFFVTVVQYWAGRQPEQWVVPMQQIADWLEKLGLGQYALRFAENGIDLGVLPELTDQDFERLGVLLGHRRKMLRAIAELNQAELVAEPADPARCRATPPHRHVLRPGRFDGAFGAPRSRGHVGGDPRLSGRLREGHCHLRRHYRQVRRRRNTCLFRLSPLRTRMTRSAPCGRGSTSSPQ